MALNIDEDCNDFLPWLEGKAGAKVCDAVSIGRSIYGRAVYATKNIRRGACILRVPFSVQLTASNLPPEIASVLGVGVNNAAKVALFVLYEKRLGRNSEWAPYTTRLPLLEDMHSTIFWSNEELEMIRPCDLYEDTIVCKREIEESFLAVRPVFDRFPDRFQDVTLEEFTYAHALVKSRAWESVRRGASMIPFADFMNHDANPGAIVVTDYENAYLEVIADKDFAPGEEVLVRYGQYPNETLLLSYGFTVSNNRYDVFNIDLNVPNDDPLYIDKKIVIRTLYLYTSSWNSFTISEVENGDVEGRGIPEAFRTFGRVLDCKTEEELDELVIGALQNEGRVPTNPLMDNEREIAAHQFLLSIISHAIEKRNECMDRLEPNQPNLSETSVLRIKFARDVLTGELRVLKSASDWLESYCLWLQMD